ncbi:MAG: GNAT family N-acetyltransferase [Clostridia bacterium]|nr:GNAT family N-acetyltransferase [Clostridia bacterium]
MSAAVRAACPADAEALLALNTAFNGVSEITAQQIRRSIQSNDREQVFVAEREGTVIGFCCVQVFKSFCYAVNYAEITELYVADGCRSQGVGGTLLRFAEQYFRDRGIHDFQLFTGGDNTSAQAFYEKSGYSKTDEIMYRKRG